MWSVQTFGVIVLVQNLRISEGKHSQLFQQTLDYQYALHSFEKHHKIQKKP